MMKSWVTFNRAIILTIGVIVIAFNVLLYNFCEQQKAELNSIKDKQDVESEFNSNKFKYEEDRIERLSKDLETTQQQIQDQKDALADQKDALLQEVQKRQQIENDSKAVQTSLVDIKAEADAIKQDMKGWQKDYVSVLVQLEKKIDDSKNETKNVEDNLAALNIPELKENIESLKTDVEKLASPVDNSAISTPLPATATDKPVERTQYESQ